MHASPVRHVIMRRGWLVISQSRQIRVKSSRNQESFLVKTPDAIYIGRRSCLGITSQIQSHSPFVFTGSFVENVIFAVDAQDTVLKDTLPAIVVSINSQER
jgi:hypothetical protein